MLNELHEEWISILYRTRKGFILPSITKQLGHQGLYLDLDSLPIKPISFKEMFIRWLISINKTRLEKGEEPIITKELVLKCPLWKLVHIPLKKILMTKEGMHQSSINTSVGSTRTTGTIGTSKTIRTIS